MVGKVGFKINGASAMQQLMRQLGARAPRRLGNNAVRAGGRVAVKSIKGEIEARDLRDSGDLLGEIQVSSRRRGVAPNEARVTVHNGKAFHGLFPEFGTVNQPATPFFRPGFEKAAGPALEAMGKTMARGIARETEKLRKRGFRGGRR